MFQWQPSATLGDDYEIKLLNGVLGVQKPLHNGTMVYMSPLGKGVSRPQANWNQGWGTPDASFWCCYGTAVESFAKLGDSIYFQHRASTTLWISQYISSDLRWAAAGLNVTQKSDYTADSTAFKVTITLTEAAAVATASAAADVSASAKATINIRIPAWAVPERTTLTLNGRSVFPTPGHVKPGEFLAITAAFGSGDTIVASVGMEARLSPLNDARPEYASVAAIMYGPLVLAGLTAAPKFALRADAKEVAKWLAVEPGMSFTAPGGWRLLPLNQIVDQPYTAYFNISETATN